jgi:hypothetical protein
LPRGTTKNINTVSPFLTLAYLYERDPRPEWRAHLEEWAAWLMAPDGLPKTEEGGFQHIVYNDENPGEMWDDTLMMSVLPLARIGLLLNKPDYVEEARASSWSISNISSTRRPACGSMAGTLAAAQFCAGAVGAGQLLGDDRHSRGHRDAGPARRRCLADLPGRYAGGAGAHSGRDAG